MRRNIGTVVVGAAVLGMLAGCAYQDPLGLPDLGPPAQSGSSLYGSYSPYYGYGYNYGYGSGYRPGYDPYYNHYYGGADPRYYGPDVVYVPYPVPCADENNDDRCDKRPRRGADDDDHGGGGKHDGIPRWPGARDGDGKKGDGPRLRREYAERYGAPGTTPRVQPAPRAAAPPPPRPAQVRPQASPPRVAPLAASA